MKICVPVLGHQNNGRYFMANDFYKANLYCLYNLETDEVEYFSKSELMTRFGLDLRMPGSDEIISAIISPNVRPMAYKILHDNQVAIFKPTSNLVQENIELLKEGKLSLFEPRDIESSSCGSSCSSCSSTSCSAN
ncbi:hypothetical protein ACUNWD_13575 [Sunxiuqinia sp. A32]|uniref:hypothetical protein n=1 Tax=Sunxiuqinia sp. A32 TaxID=3461496 RepID=UPI004045FC9A